MKKCFVCQKEFKNEMVLRQHHSDTSCGQSSKCRKCQKECGNRSALFRHLEEAHPKGSGAAFAGGGTAAPRHYSNTSRDEEFPPLPSQVPKTKSLSKPVITVKTGALSYIAACSRCSQFEKAVMSAKKEHEAERSRREMLKVQGQIAEKERIAAEWQELQEAEWQELQELRKRRKGHRHKLTNYWPPRCKW